MKRQMCDAADALVMLSITATSQKHRRIDMFVAVHDSLDFSDPEWVDVKKLIRTRLITVSRRLGTDSVLVRKLRSLGRAGERVCYFEIFDEHTKDAYITAVYEKDDNVRLLFKHELYKFRSHEVQWDIREDGGKHLFDINVHRVGALMPFAAKAAKAL